MNPPLQRAALLIDHGRYLEAEKELASALAREPDHFLAHMLMAVCLLHREQFEQATERARQSVGLAPDHPRAHYILAMVLLARNRLDEAEASLSEAIALDPFDADYQVLLGRIGFLHSRWQQALDAAEAALTLDPEHIGALNLRAESLRRLGRAGAAEDQLRAALAVRPDSAETHASLGWLALQEGSRKKAIEHFRESLRLDPEFEPAREGVVESLKAWNPVYRLLLKYVFLMQRFGRGSQWLVILGIWLAFNVVKHVGQTYPASRFVIWPLLIAYGLFVLTTWIGRPLADLALRLHPLGRLALSREERVASNWIGGFLLGAILSGITCVIIPHRFWGTLALALAGMLIPLGAAFQSRAPWPRKPLTLYAIVVACLGTVAVARMACSDAMLETWPVPLATLWDVLAIVSICGFLLGVVLAPWAGNLLMSIRWKR